MNTIWLKYAFISFLIALHIGSLIAFVSYFSWTYFFYSLVLWQLLSTIGISVCYHRQITHKSFSTGKVLKNIHLFCALLSGQAGPLVWAHVHRVHHRHSDEDLDPHSPKAGFWSGHLGWIVNDEKRKDNADLKKLPKDLLNDFEVMLFQKIHYPVLALLFIFLYAFLGVEGLLWFGCFRITLTLHSAWIINSSGHLWGYQNFDNGDKSRNSKLLALLTAGEGLHNNHHAMPSSAKLSYHKGEFDLGYMYIKSLERLGLAKIKNILL